MVEHRGGFLDEVGVQLGDEAVLLRGVRRHRAKPLADDPLHARLEALEERVVQPTRVERVKKTFFSVLGREFELSPRCASLPKIVRRRLGSKIGIRVGSCYGKIDVGVCVWVEWRGELGERGDQWVFACTVFDDSLRKNSG